MIRQDEILKAVFLACLCVLSACGGGGSSVGIDGSGSKPQDSVSGPINGFGSVIVNGTRFNTDNADFFVRGMPSTEDELRVGNYITVIGDIDESGQAVAREVYYQPSVSGRILNTDASKNTLRILGLTVHVTDETLFGPRIKYRHFSGLREGDNVSISGSKNAQGDLVASRIEMHEVAQVELSGQVKNLDQAMLTFELADQRIDYSQLFNTDDIENGTEIWVAGTLENGVLTATYANTDMNPKRLFDIKRNEIVGVVSRLQADRLTVNGVDVRLSSETRYEDGTRTLLKDGMRISVLGSFVSGSLAADRVLFLKQPTTQTVGVINRIGRVKGEYIYHLVVGETEAFLASNSIISSSFDSRLEFSELNVGDFVVLNTYETENGESVIKRLMVEPQEDREYEFFGIAIEADDAMQTFRLRDHIIEISSDTTLQLGEIKSLTELNGKVVEVKGRFEGDRIKASEVRLRISTKEDIRRRSFK